jgi:hypothetical protein
MILKNLLRLINDKEPDSLVPAKISFRSYFQQSRNPEIWFMLFDLCHYHDMRPNALIRYLIIVAHSELNREKSAKAD